MAQGAFSSNGNYVIDVDAALQSQNQAGNYSTIYWRVLVYKLSGSGYWSAPDGGNNGAADSNMGGNPDLWSASGFAYDFRTSSGVAPGQSVMFAQGTFNVPHDANGDASYFVNGAMNLVSLGSASAGTGWRGLPTIVNPPGAPSSGSLTSIGPTTMTYSFTAGATNGGGFTQHVVQWSQSSTFASGVSQATLGGGDRSYNVTGLTPGTRYYFRTYSYNSAGASAAGAFTNAQTLTSTPPTVFPQSSISGTSATVSVTPADATGVTGYNLEWRPVGGSSTAVSGTSPFTINSLTPGQTYEYRAATVYGTSYTTAFSSWVQGTQNQPNVSPGKYFDGSSAATPDVTYSWAGMANLSQSIATGRGVTGWEITASGAGGNAVIQQITGGYSGTYAARCVIKKDAVGAGVTLGGQYTDPYRATVLTSTPYVGSVWVRPSRAQRLSLFMVFQPGGVIQGPSVVCQPNVWTRLTVTGTTTGTTTRAVLRVADTTGTGWSVWQSGEWFDVDGAMITLLSIFDYFDGSTVATPQYSYAWTGTPHASTSYRTTLVVPELDPLQDPDCDPIPAPPSPPEIPADCIEDIGVWRRLTYRINASDVSLVPDTVPTFYLTTKGSAARQARLRIYENPNDLDPSMVDTMTWDAELIVTYIPPLTTMVLDGVSQRAWVNINGGESRTANQLLYGTDGTPATWPVLKCGIGYVITLDVSTEAPADNLSLTADLTERS